MKKKFDRLGIRILPVLLFFAIRSSALADLAWEPASGPESADATLKWLIRILIILAVGLVWLIAKARMLGKYIPNGIDAVIPFYGRYLEYKCYWDEMYYWLNFGVVCLGLVLTIAEFQVMYVPLAVWALITVRMRMKTMEAFGWNKYLGLLELLGLGMVLDCICAFAHRRTEAESEPETGPDKTDPGQPEIPPAERREPWTEALKSKIPEWVWIAAAFFLIISEFLLYQYDDKKLRLGMTQTVQALTEQVQTALSAAETSAAETTKTPNPFGFYAGDIITFGTYEQDEQSGADPVEWQVLAVEDGRALLLSRYGLETKMYHETMEDITWENSDLRAWLNGSFYSSAFTPAEKARIQSVRISNPGDRGHETEGGNDTEDAVFLLSLDEAKKYLLTNASRQCEATYHARQNGALVNPDGYSWWWLRTPSGRIRRNTYVHADGYAPGGASPVTNEDYVVRPALWIGP